MRYLLDNPEVGVSEDGTAVLTHPNPRLSRRIKMRYNFIKSEIGVCAGGNTARTHPNPLFEKIQDEEILRDEHSLWY